MGIGVPRLQRQLAVSAAAIATMLALAPHARAELLPAAPVSPVATAAVALDAAVVGDVSNGVPATVEAVSKPVAAVRRAVVASPVLRAAAAPVARRIAPVIRPVVEPVRAVTLHNASRIASLVASAPPAAVRPSAIGHAPDHAVRRPHTASSPHPVAGQSPAPRTGRPATPHASRSALHVTRDPLAPRSITDRRIAISPFTLLGTGWAAAGSASSAGSPAGSEALALFSRPFALILRLVVPHHAPRSHIQLLTLERPD